jgi:hypothetical protein
MFGTEGSERAAGLGADVAEVFVEHVQPIHPSCSRCSTETGQKPLPEVAQTM